MPAAPHTEAALNETEPARVYSWRVAELERAGYSELQAKLIADSDADLHMAVDLLRRGCPRPVAMRILRPDDPTL